MIREVLYPPQDAPWKIKTLIEAGILMMNNKQFIQAIKNFEDAWD